MIRSGRAGSTIRFAMISTAVVLAFGCSKGEKASEVGPGARAARLKAGAVVVEGRPVERTVESSGTLSASEEVTVSNDVPGVVAVLYADLGDRVKAGDRLAGLDEREYALQLRDAEASRLLSVRSMEREKARLAEAEAAFKRQEGLHAEGLASESLYDAAKTQYEVASSLLGEAEARIAQADARHLLAAKRLDDAVVKAPISGEISKRYVSVGEGVRDRVRFFTIVAADTLKFRGSVAEADSASVKPGQEVSIRVEPHGERVFKGRLTRVSPAVDVETRTLNVEAELANVGGALKPGFFAKAIIQTGSDEGATFVPEAAVYSYMGVTKVFVMEGGKAHERPVATGVRQGGSIEVRGELKPGETVATTNLQNLFDGADVEPSAE
jgi:RND family efflux transporter MFP subunit